MAVYLTQGRYSSQAIEGMINKPEDRAVAVAALVKSAGGKLIDYYVTFGEHDFMAIVEGGRGKNETDFMAALFAAAATGGVTNLKTTVGVRSKDAMKAMRAAKKVLREYKPAGQMN